MTNKTIESSADYTIAQRIYKALEIEAQGEQRRPHLGASIIGKKCERAIWLEFRWANPKATFPGRILRLFRRGHMEESSVYADLRAAGYTVQDIDHATGKQYAFKDGHFGGSCDGMIVAGPGIESPELLEIKTHNAKSFSDLVKHGVKASKPQHYAQMQVYCRAFGAERSTYFAVCKDTDDIYTESVEHDAEFSKAMNDRAQRIIADQSPPPPISTDPTWYECKFCDSRDLCHGSKLTKQVNCRTCAHSTPERDGTWSCAEWNAEIPYQRSQEAGCNKHIFHPHLTPWDIKDTLNAVIWLTPAGQIRSDEYTSREIAENWKACAQGESTKDIA